MSWLVITAACFIIAVALHRYFLSTTARFWRLVAKHPDLALALMAEEPSCLVDIPPPTSSKRDYTGPFRLMDSTGRIHAIHIMFSQINEAQSRIARQIKVINP